MDLDQMITFLQDRWLVVVVAIIALVVIVKIVKTVVKWVLVLAIVGGLIFYGANYTEQLKELGENVAAQAKEAFDGWKEKAIQGLAGKDAEYTDNGDGTFTITTAGNIRLDGTTGSDKIKVTIAGVSAEFTLDDTLREAIEAVRQKG